MLWFDFSPEEHYRRRAFCFGDEGGGGGGESDGSLGGAASTAEAQGIGVESDPGDYGDIGANSLGGGLATEATSSGGNAASTGYGGGNYGAFSEGMSGGLSVGDMNAAADAAGWGAPSDTAGNYGAFSTGMQGGLSADDMESYAAAGGWNTGYMNDMVSGLAPASYDQPVQNGIAEFNPAAQDPYDSQFNEVHAGHRGPDAPFGNTFAENFGNWNAQPTSAPQAVSTAAQAAPSNALDADVYDENQVSPVDVASAPPGMSFSDRAADVNWNAQPAQGYQGMRDSVAAPSNPLSTDLGITGISGIQELNSPFSGIGVSSISPTTSPQGLPSQQAFDPLGAFNYGQPTATAQAPAQQEQVYDNNQVSPLDQAYAPDQVSPIDTAFLGPPSLSGARQEDLFSNLTPEAKQGIPSGYVLGPYDLAPVSQPAPPTVSQASPAQVAAPAPTDVYAPDQVSPLDMTGPSVQSVAQGYAAAPTDAFNAVDSFGLGNLGPTTQGVAQSALAGTQVAAAAPAAQQAPSFEQEVAFNQNPVQDWQNDVTNITSGIPNASVADLFGPQMNYGQTPQTQVAAAAPQGDVEEEAPASPNAPSGTAYNNPNTLGPPGGLQQSAPNAQSPAQIASVQPTSPVPEGGENAGGGSTYQPSSPNAFLSSYNQSLSQTGGGQSVPVSGGSGAPSGGGVTVGGPDYVTHRPSEDALNASGLDPNTFNMLQRLYAQQSAQSRQAIIDFARGLGLRAA